ncbi:MAG: N-acetylmannosaminyltransferase [Epulopiscium sp. Nele67-Bin005]|nr:MAG: N-acetylmannosaminyltransferase [Epulopiscium sp. Nele67-Bin005]
MAKKLKRKKITIMDIKIDKVTMNDAVEIFHHFLKTDKLRTICTPNPEIIMQSKENAPLKNFVNSADLVLPDGIGVVIASKILPCGSLPERVAGYDFVQKTMQTSKNKAHKYYFFGGKPEVAQIAANNMRQKYPQIDVVGTHDGYFSDEDTQNIIDDINNSGANILLVALGSPKQELWILENGHKFTNLKVVIGVGGSLDVMAGVVKRAPKIFQQFGCEWLYRLISEPKRAKRMLVLPVFLVQVICMSLSHYQKKLIGE